MPPKKQKFLKYFVFSLAKFLGNFLEFCFPPPSPGGPFDLSSLLRRVENFSPNQSIMNTLVYSIQKIITFQEVKNILNVNDLRVYFWWEMCDERCVCKCVYALCVCVCVYTPH